MTTFEITLSQIILLAVLAIAAGIWIHRNGVSKGVSKGVKKGREAEQFDWQRKLTNLAYAWDTEKEINPNAWAKVKVAIKVHRGSFHCFEYPPNPTIKLDMRI